MLKLCRERPGASGRERTYKVLAEVVHSGLLGGKPGNSKTKALIWWVVNGETGAGQKTEQLPAGTDGKRSEIIKLGPSLLVTMEIHGSKTFGSTGQSILTCQNMV